MLTQFALLVPRKFRHGVHDAIREHKSAYRDKTLMFNPPDAIREKGIYGVKFIDQHGFSIFGFQKKSPTRSSDLAKGEWKSREA